MSKSSKHIVHITAEQYKKLAGDATETRFTDDDGTMAYVEINLKGVAVNLIHTVEDDSYLAVVPRCMLANKALKAIEQAA